MSSFTTTDLGFFYGRRFAIFTFHQFWSFEDLTWLIHSYGFDHSDTDHLLVVAPIIQQMVQHDLLPENKPVGAFASIMPVTDREYSHMIPTALVREVCIQYLSVPVYKGVSGWGFLVSQPHPCG
jgi:hypothetical protein